MPLTVAITLCKASYQFQLQYSHLLNLDNNPYSTSRHSSYYNDLFNISFTARLSATQRQSLFVSCLSLHLQNLAPVGYTLYSLLDWLNNREKFKAITSCYYDSWYLWVLFRLHRRGRFLVWVSILHYPWLRRSWGKRPTVNPQRPTTDPWS